VKRLLSSEHFSVDGTLIEAWASIKSFRRKDGGDQDNNGAGRNAERSFHKEKRSNATHESTTDPEARLYKKGDGQPAKLCYMGDALMENRHGLAVLGGGLRWAPIRPMMVTAFAEELRSRRVTPHIAIDGHLSKTGKPRKTAIGKRTLRHAGYAASQRCRKQIEEVFGWMKSAAGLAKVKLRGRDRVDAAFTLALAVCNLIRLPKRLGAATSRASGALSKCRTTRRTSQTCSSPPTFCSTARAAASSPSAASAAPSTARATQTPSPSHGTATTKWTKLAAMAPPRSSRTARKFSFRRGT
jgi:hypothetical protein